MRIRSTSKRIDRSSRRGGGLEIDLSLPTTTRLAVNFPRGNARTKIRIDQIIFFHLKKEYIYHLDKRIKFDCFLQCWGEPSPCSIRPSRGGSRRKKWGRSSTPWDTLSTITSSRCCSNRRTRKVYIHPTFLSLPPLFFLFLCKTRFRSIIRAIIISSFFFSFSERLARRRIDRLRSSERGRIIIHDIIWPETRGTTCTAVNESRTGKTHSAYTVLSQPALCLPVFITRAAFNFFQSILIAPPICTQT